MEAGFKIIANIYKRLKAPHIDYSLFLLSTYLYVILSEHDNNYFKYSLPETKFYKSFNKIWYRKGAKIYTSKSV